MIHPVKTLALHVGRWAGAAAFFPLLGVVLGLSINDAALAGFFGVFVIHSVVGLGGSYFLHEAAHLVLLSKYPTIEKVEVTASWARFSVHPSGSVTPLQAIGVGLSGPVACCIVGAVLWQVGSPLAAWYLGHLVFLLPVFGDGKAVLMSLRRLRAVSS
ncbi:hypothetical protein ACLH0K_13875 [Arthrobacter sp. MPF02]|uniref:hypothetical protein n=1 Tax=Arthrobacter sp. MPF02 TaxID=3388492 RepID=UPI003985059E